jgi:hypothetical protein
MADAHFNLANLYYEKEQLGLAVAHYRHALELKPNWEKAERCLAQAEAALAAAEGVTQARPSADQTGEVPATPPNPERQVDPTVHGGLLTTLHKATIESENYGRAFLKVVESEIEPAIKELSSCLLYPDSTAAELDECVHKFETAISSMRAAQKGLRTCMERVRNLGDQLLRS